MELKTKINAVENTQDLDIVREFDLPVELLFTAFEKAELIEQWMGTKVLELNSSKHGAYEFETTDPMGNRHIFHGTIHEFIPNKSIVRTFEMANTPFPPQLEYLTFESIDANRSRLTMHVVYKSADVRLQVLQLPFAKGISMAHDRIEKLLASQN